MKLSLVQHAPKPFFGVLAALPELDPIPADEILGT
jgi:hypothetical protein